MLTTVAFVISGDTCPAQRGTAESTVKVKFNEVFKFKIIALKK